MIRTNPCTLGIVGAILAALTACSTGAPPLTEQANAHPTAALPPVEVETGLVHVHGLGVDPADGTLYAATHSGLFRVSQQGKSERVANREQDTMGFSVVGPGTFIGSGHPDFREDDVRPPLLGLIESDDAGQTWKRLSLHGQADFHTLAAAHGQVYGYDSTSGTFMVSRDKQTWDRRSQLPMRDFAVDPMDQDRIVATAAEGPVVSNDGGRSWTLLVKTPRLVVLSWKSQAGLFGIDVRGGVHRSADAGNTWVPLGSVGGAPEAMTVDGRSVFVAVSGKGILESRDGGRTFATRYAESSS